MSNNISAVKALELVKQQKFHALNSVVVDSNATTESVKYPQGFDKCFLSLDNFEELYSKQKERKATYTVKLPISKLAYKQGQVRMVRPEFCIQNFELFNNDRHMLDGSIKI